MRLALFGRLQDCVEFPAEPLRQTVSRFAKLGLVGVTLVLGGASQAQTVASLPSNGQVIEKSGSAKPVAAWNDFCRRYPTECDLDLAEPARIEVTQDMWRAIMSVNRRVNARIKPMTDKAHWGVVDRWDLAEDGYGDCEDYQLLKRKILVEQYGLPRRALRITVVVDEQGEGHAVMMVRTDSGDLVLDNKRSAILSWQDTGYVFVKREGQDSRDWVSLGDRSSPAT